MIGCPAIGQHLIETRIVVVQAQEEFTQVGPRLDPMTLGAGEDREQDGRARPGLLAAQEQPILPANRLVPERSFTDVVVDRQPTVLGVATERLPLILGVRDGLAERTLGQRPTSQLGQVVPRSDRAPAPPLADEATARAGADNSRARSSMSYSCRIHSKIWCASRGELSCASKNLRRACAQQATSRIASFDPR